MDIRLAKKEDAVAIALLGRTTFTETFGHLFNDSEGLRNYLNSTFSVSKIEQSLNKPNNRYWIALVDKLPVGYAKLKLKSTSEFIKTKNISQLQKIYVLKDFLSMKIDEGSIKTKSTNTSGEEIRLFRGAYGIESKKLYVDINTIFSYDEEIRSLIQ